MRALGELGFLVVAAGAGRGFSGAQASDPQTEAKHYTKNASQKKRQRCSGAHARKLNILHAWVQDQQNQPKESTADELK
ncbi:MAG: hypothetical protein ACE15B_09470 [Bryobacteraceae bacterium]